MSTPTERLQILGNDRLDRIDQNGFFVPGREVKTKPTSFTPETAEVEVARQHFREGRPTIVYEWVQNILDYNDYSKGNPEIVLILRDGQKIDYQALLLLDSDGLAKIAQVVDRMKIVNHIREGEHLSPGHLTQMYHGGGSDTLGQHGRGGKIGAAAVLAEGAAESIRYASRDQRGNWRAEYYFADDNDVVMPEFSVAYQYDEEATQALDTTELIIEKPSLQLLDTLRGIPHFFLPTNPAYEGFRFANAEQREVKQTLFTVSIQPNESAERWAVFSEEEMRRNLNITDPEAHFTEVPRVEILPLDIVRNRSSERYKDDALCVDGLRLDTNGYAEYYALRWAFWGMRGGNRGFRAARSNDSRSVDGSFSSLMAETLGKCDNPAVFEAIFDASHDGRSCQEASLPYSNWVVELKNHPKAQEALTQAWTSFLAKNNFPKDAALTTSSEVLKKMKKQYPDQPVILFSHNAANLINIVKSLGLAKDADTGFTFVEKPKAKESGEVQMFDALDLDNTAILDKTFEALIDLDGQNVETNNEEIVLRLPNFNQKLYETYDSLPEPIKNIIRQVVGMYGHVLEVVVDSDDGDRRCTTISSAEGSGRSVRTDGRRTTKVTNFHGKSTGEVGIFITLRVPETDEELLPGPYEEKFSGLVSQYQDLLAELLQEDGRVNLDKFIDRFQQFEHTSRALALVQANREFIELQRINHDLMRQMGLIPEDRSSASPTRDDTRPRKQVPYKSANMPEKTYTMLFMPNAEARARTSGLYGDSQESVEGEEPPGYDEVQRQLKEKLTLLKSPDIHMFHPELLPPHSRTRLVSTYNRLFSGEVSETLIEDIKGGKKEDSAGSRINKILIAGTSALPIAPECYVTGFFHPDEAVMAQLKVYGSPDRLVYSIHSDVEIPAGLEIYYKHIGNEKRDGAPTIAEKRVLLRPEAIRTVDDLGELIEAIITHTPPLSDKQKVDIISAAWAYTFTYDDNLEINDIYAGLDGGQYYKKLLTRSIGNCGHAAEGLVVLLRMCGLPATSYLGYLGKNGRFFPGSQNHAQVDVFIDGEWVVIEPQTGTYVSSRYQQEKLPAGFLQLIQDLPEGKTKPSGIAYQDPLENLGLRPLLRQIMEMGDAGEELFELLEQAEQTLHEDEGVFREHSYLARPPEVTRRYPPADVNEVLAEALRLGVVSPGESPNTRSVLERLARQIEDNDDAVEEISHLPQGKKRALQVVASAVFSGEASNEDDEEWLAGLSDSTRQALKSAITLATDEVSAREVEHREVSQGDERTYHKLQRLLIEAARIEAEGGEGGAAIQSELAKVVAQAVSLEGLQELRDGLSTGVETSALRLQRSLVEAVNEVQQYAETTVILAKKQERMKAIKHAAATGAVAIFMVLVISYFALTAPDFFSKISHHDSGDTSGEVAPDELAEMSDGIDGDLAPTIESDPENMSELVLNMQSRDELMASVEEALAPTTAGELSTTYSEKSNLIMFLLFLLSNGISAVGGSAVASLWRMHRKAQDEYSE